MESGVEFETLSAYCDIYSLLKLAASSTMQTRALEEGAKIKIVPHYDWTPHTILKMLKHANDWGLHWPPRLSAAELPTTSEKVWREAVYVIFIEYYCQGKHRNTLDFFYPAISAPTDFDSEIHYAREVILEPHKHPRVYGVGNSEDVVIP